MVKKAKKTKARTGSSTKRKAPNKTRRPEQSARERKISERIYATDNDPTKVNDALLAMTLEIDRTYSGGPSLKLGEVTARIHAAKRAFHDAILSTDNLDDWIAAARRAARLS